jgi:aminopeptidase N
VQGAAVAAVNQLDPKQALALAKAYEKDNEGALTQAMISVYATSGGDAEWPFVYSSYDKAVPQAKFGMIRNFAAMTGHLTNPVYVQQAIGAIKNFGVKYKQFGVAPTMIGVLTEIKTARTKLNDDVSAKAADDAIKAINDAK